MSTSSQQSRPEPVYPGLPVGAVTHEQVAQQALVNQLVANERAMRALQAEQMELYAQAIDLAGVQSSVLEPRSTKVTRISVESSTPQGSQAEMALRSIRADIACALRLSEGVVDRRISQAWELTYMFGAVFDALKDGEISDQHTRVITEAALPIGSGFGSETNERRAKYADEVLTHARGTTPNRLRPIAQRIAEAYAGLTIDERFAEAVQERRVEVREMPDGMAWLSALLPAAQAYGAHSRLMKVSRAIADAGGSNGRTRDQVRADVFTDLLLSSCPESEQAKLEKATTERLAAEAITADESTDETLIIDGLKVGDPVRDLAQIHAEVQVLVTAELLKNGSLIRGEIEREDSERCGSEPGGSEEDGLKIDGHDLDGLDLDELDLDPSLVNPSPAMLQGYGPIDSGTARHLAGTTEAWEAIHLHPESYEILEVDRYRPSAHMKRLLRARDQHCRFMGCRAPLSRCETDHTIDAALGGPTSMSNIAYLCVRHHTLKHHSMWRVEQVDRGELVWTAPSGRAYREKAPSTVLFTPVVDRDLRY